jgi:heme exporter protein B
MSAFLALIARDLRLAVREGSALGAALGFYLIVVAMLPLGLGPDMALLSRIAPGLLWIALLLSALLTLGRLFETDLEDGSLEVMATASLPLEAVVAAKGLAHWLSTALPLTLLAPFLGLMLNLDLALYLPLMTAMLVGTPAISFIGTIGAALTLRSRRGSLLIALLVLPLYVPTLIFGIGAITSLLGPGGSEASLMILGALSLGALVLGPIAAAAALRAQLG